MSGKPIIGLPTQTQEATSDGMPRCWIMSQRYVNSVIAAGGVPFVVPLIDSEETLRSIYETLDGVYLCGGVDLDPHSYHEARHELCGRSDLERDRTELQLVRWALADRKPILGVCRGAQVINVACNGSLYQDLGSEFPGSIKHDYFPFQGRYSRDQLTHSIHIDTESRLGTLLGVRALKVNSMHHQAIERIGEGLVATAWGPDGVIEAVEGTDEEHYLMGVQWHPEELTHLDPRMRRLFAYFIAAARDYRSDRFSPAPQPMMAA